MLKLITEGQKLIRADNDVIVWGTVGYPAVLKLNGSAWENCETIVMRYEASTLDEPIEIIVTPNDKGECVHVVPWEVCRATRFKVSAIGDSSTPTTGVDVVTSMSGYGRSVEAPSAPTDTVYQQIMTAFNEALDALGSIEAAESAAQGHAADAEASAEDAAESAGESLIPSPIMITFLPDAFSFSTKRALSSGRTSA